MPTPEPLASRAGAVVSHEALLWGLDPSQTFCPGLEQTAALLAPSSSIQGLSRVVHPFQTTPLGLLCALTYLCPPVQCYCSQRWCCPKPLPLCHLQPCLFPWPQLPDLSSEPQNPSKHSKHNLNHLLSIYCVPAAGLEAVFLRITHEQWNAQAFHTEVSALDKHTPV